MEKKRDYTNQDVLVLIESELIDRKNQVSKISLKVQSNIYESLFYYIRLTREQGTEFVKFLNTVVGDNQNIKSVLDWDKMLWYLSNSIHNPTMAAMRWNRTEGKEIENTLLKDIVFNFIHNQLKKDIPNSKLLSHEKIEERIA